ncbi:hypothetical protein DUT90_10930 [Polaribacter sp. WD7]|uniref:hypothetical protein n=1 Tax=Polaribacter sp. WD7 TaxID=2269061 RepID=UPI000DF32E86|nr:hypothetical protein [Polaribacter sp. WD7]RCS26277.1 hypothetical protein DUT90_10930 [Polaribacter sp. WD7]
MRTTVKTILLVTLMFGTLISYATEITKPIKIGGKRVKVQFNAVKKGQALTIKDVNGVIIYKQDIQESGVYSKIFDLSLLKDGYYTTELEKDFEIIIQKIKVEKNTVTLFKQETTKVFKPVVRNEGNMLLVSKIAFKKQPVKVMLYYNNDMIFSETLEGKKLIERVYKLSKSEKGNYKLVLGTDGRMYTKEFTI